MPKMGAMDTTQPTHRTITDDIRDIREGQTPAAAMRATPIAKSSGYETALGMSAGWVAYRCEPPYLGQYDHVRVSAAIVMGEPETYVFPCDEDGKVTDWGELDGFKGACDVARAIAQMGYEVPS